jgi:hypothetical protein
MRVLERALYVFMAAAVVLLFWIIVIWLSWG